MSRALERPLALREARKLPGKRAFGGDHEWGPVVARVLLGTNPMEFKAQRLLVVDDEPAIRFALTEYFSSQGWTVDSAAEKEEAEALLACTEYAVVIADLRLTGIYGVEGLDIVRWSRHLRPETRVILLTGNGTPEIEFEARRRGADAFLHKPLPLPEVEAVVASLLRAGS